MAILVTKIQHFLKITFFKTLKYVNRTYELWLWEYDTEIQLRIFWCHFSSPLLLTLNLGHNGLMCVWKSCYHYSIGTPRGRFVQDIGWKMENLSTTTGITRFTSGHPHVKQPDLVYITVRNVFLTTCILFFSFAKS